MEPRARLRVLLVDDDPWVRAVTAQALAYRGRIEVVEAATGAEGVDAARLERPDCVLLDRFLPDCDGPEVLAKIRALGGASPPVVFVTALLDERERSGLLELGAADVLSKPVDLPALGETVERIVERFRAG